MQQVKSCIHMNMHREYMLDDVYEYVCLDELFSMFRCNHIFILILPCLGFYYVLFAILDMM